MNRLGPPWRRYLTASGGSAAVELALVLPLLTLLMFGFIEVGRLYWTYNVAASAARDAARYAARLPITCNGAAGSFVTPGDAANVQNVARTGQPASGGSPVVGGWTNNSDVAVSVTCIAGGAAYLGRYDGMAWVPHVSVAATVPFNTAMSSLLPGLALINFTVSNQQAWTE